MNIQNIYAVAIDGYDTPTDYIDSLIDQIVDTVCNGSDSDYESLCIASNATEGGQLVPLTYCPFDKLHNDSGDLNNGYAHSHTRIDGRSSNLIFWDHNTTYVKKEKGGGILCKIPFIGKYLPPKQEVYLTPYHNFQHETFHARQRTELGEQGYRDLSRKKRENDTMAAKRYSKHIWLENHSDFLSSVFQSSYPYGVFTNYRNKYSNTDYTYESDRHGKSW